MFAGTGTEQKLHYKILNRNKTDKKKFDWLTHNFFYTWKKWHALKDCCPFNFITYIDKYVHNKKIVIKIIHKIQKLCKISANIWTEILAGTEISDIAGTETGISVPVPISAGTGTEPNFGRSLSMKHFLS